MAASLPTQHKLSDDWNKRQYLPYTCVPAWLVEYYIFKFFRVKSNFFNYFEHAMARLNGDVPGRVRQWAAVSP